MRRLPDGTALAIGDQQDLDDLVVCLGDLRAGHRHAEFVLGIGACTSPPARVVGFASKAAKLIQETKSSIGIATLQIRIFSTVSKVAKVGTSSVYIADHCISAFVSLVAALRAAGVVEPINIDIANPNLEVPSHFAPPNDITSAVGDWLDNAADNNQNGADSHTYAREHAGSSMFGDLGDTPIVWMGPKPETKFWAVRQMVRRNARCHGRKVAPSIGLIPTSIRRPWYLPTTSEPALERLATCSADEVAGVLMDASNPTLGGNSGIKSEAKAANRGLHHPLMKRAALGIASKDIIAQLRLLSSEARIGVRLSQLTHSGELQ